MVNEILVTSTTDPKEAVEAAAKAEPNKEGVLVAPTPAKEEKPGEKPPEEKPSEKPEEGKEEKPAEAKTEGKPEEKPEEGKEKKGGWQKRVDKLTEQNYRLRTQLEQLQVQSKPPAAAPTAKARPQEKDFEEYDKYIEALADWKADERIAASRRQDAEAAQLAEANEVLTNYNNKLVVAREKYEDWEEVVGASEVAIPMVVQTAILNLDNGPDVAYHLAKNKELLEDLKGMNDLQAVMHIGRLSSSLAGKETKPAEAAPAVKPAAKAEPPKPIKPVGGSSTKVTLPLDDDGVSYAEYVRRREAGEGR